MATMSTMSSMATVTLAEEPRRGREVEGDPQQHEQREGQAAGAHLVAGYW